MKRAVIITIIVAMFGWAVYDYMSKADNEETVEPTVKEEEGTFTNESENNDEKENDEANVGLKKGMQAPDFELETIDGKTARLSDFRGERVLLNFWATWCPPCRAEMPDMQRFHEDTNIQILAVNLTATKNETPDKVEDFLDKYGITFPVLLDEELEVSYLYQIQPIPTNYLINPDGTIHNVAYGALNYELMVSEYQQMD